MNRNAVLDDRAGGGRACLAYRLQLADGIHGYVQNERAGNAGDGFRLCRRHRPVQPVAHVGIWVAALFTLCIFSFLYRDNPFYKMAEAVLIGVSAAYWMVVAFWTTIIPNLLGKLYPHWISPGPCPAYRPCGTRLVRILPSPGPGRDAVVEIVSARVVDRAMAAGIHHRRHGGHPAGRLPSGRLSEPDPQQHNSAGRDADGRRWSGRCGKHHHAD